MGVAGQAVRAGAQRAEPGHRGEPARHPGRIGTGELPEQTGRRFAPARSPFSPLPSLLEDGECPGHLSRAVPGAVQPPLHGGHVGALVQGRGGLGKVGVRERDAGRVPGGGAEVVQEGPQQQGAARAGPDTALDPCRRGVGVLRAHQAGRRVRGERGQGVGIDEGGREGVGEARGWRIDVVLAAFGDGQQDRQR